MEFSGTAKGLASGQKILLKTLTGDWYCRTIGAITELEQSFQLALTPSLPSGKRWTYAIGHFKTSTHAQGHDINNTSLCTLASDTTSDIEVQLDTLPEPLIYGRMLWVVSDTQAQLVKLLKTEQNQRSRYGYLVGVATATEWPI
ncbi:hypothetical protein [Pseudoalteromonas sp. GB56]